MFLFMFLEDGDSKKMKVGKKAGRKGSKKMKKRRSSVSSLNWLRLKIQQHTPDYELTSKKSKNERSSISRSERISSSVS